MARMLALVLFAAVATLSGCARPSQRIAAELQQQGFDPAAARCIGDRMEERLTMSQLLRLRAALRHYRDRVGNGPTIDFAGLMTMAQDIGDPRIVVETVGAGITCRARR
jgi:hypothetical protein